MRGNVWHECLCYAVYYAPRGRKRLLMLGEGIAQRYLASTDQLVGIIGESGIGKSSLIHGMFPGLELTNDDENINVRPVPLIRMHRDGRFTVHTFHIDVRFEMAFTQVHEISEAIRAALRDGRRIVVEHFEVIYPVLRINAQFLMGVGEEIIVARPDVFGPAPEDIVRAVEGTAVYRKMAHSSEDITAMILERDYGFPHLDVHSDVPRGFVIEFDEEPPGLDLEELERKVREVIAKALPISYHDDEHITIGGQLQKCTGPRIHVGNSSEILNFRIVKQLVREEITGRYCLVGLVGDPKPARFVGRHPESSKLP